MSDEVKEFEPYVPPPVYTGARLPRWADAAHTMIDLLVTFPNFGELMFTASPRDTAEHGRELFARALKGDFGPIAPYQPPTYTDEQLAQMARDKRDQLLGEAAIRIAPLQDAVDLGEATPEETAALTAWKRYRIALNRIELQASFPRDIQWPERPA
jgi:hypothetical protein